MESEGFENDYAADDFETGDIDSGSDRAENIEKSSGDQLEAVTQLLRGDSSLADEISESGKTGQREAGTSYAVDSHGRMDTGDTPSGAESQSDAFSQSEQVYISQLTAQREQIAQQTQMINDKREELQQRYLSGNLNQQEYDHASFILGNYMGQIQRSEYDNKIAGYELEKSLAAANSQLEQAIGEDWSPAKRQETAQALSAYLQGEGIDPAAIMDIGDAPTVAAVYRAHKAITEADSLRDENARLKAAVKNLRGESRAARKQGQRAMQAGVTGDKQSQNLQEIMDVLNGAGHKGGRR